MKYLKAIISVFLIINYICFASLAKLFIQDPAERRRFYLKHVSRQSKIYFELLGIKIEIDHPERIIDNKNYLIVSNHMSYLDALILASVRPACFITSMEMKETPVLGLLTELGGCLYTERRSKENIQGEISEITEALKAGFDIVIFPEATSTNGERIFPFKRSLLNAAVQSGKSLLPIVIQYEEINGEKVTVKNRDALCWYGDMGFASHFFNLAGQRNIRIKLKVLAEIPVTPDSTRDTLVEQVYNVIHDSYVPIC